MLIAAIVLTLLILSIVLFFSSAVFGARPSGARLVKIRQSPNYRNGAFQNLDKTPVLAEGYSYKSVLYENLFVSKPRHKPSTPLPSVKTDLLNASPEADFLVWFGHSSYYLQLSGKKFLVDPVFSGNASPLPGTMRAFKGTDVYTVDDLPEIDFLLITHDHYDHLDYPIIKQLQKKVKTVVCGLGVAAHFEMWGYQPEQIIEKDWFDDVNLSADLKLFVTPTRHFSGRGFRRNQTLWVSYVLQTPNNKIFLGGDSGLGSHYQLIAQQHPDIDLAILDNGQYNPAWCHIHHLPADLVKVIQILNPERVLPVHSSKFALANHPWDEPLIKAREASEKYHFCLVTPIIGQRVNLDNKDEKFEAWWESVD
ncbi:MBL fold metallo-hydrolase [Pelobium manganitolerans]|uniref:MBL fold metallo-hydrolase n=1 Tax=Pelobium manganitolerans TaxID=1842495 RepID=UPI003FA371F1